MEKSKSSEQNPAPEGDFVLVPREATWKMAAAALIDRSRHEKAGTADATPQQYIDAWRVMIAAAPNPPMGGEAEIRAAALSIADGMIGICETATRFANRTGNTFVLNRKRVANMISVRLRELLTRPRTVRGERETAIEECAIIAERFAIMTIPNSIQDGIASAIRALLTTRADVG